MRKTLSNSGIGILTAFSRAIMERLMFALALMVVANCLSTLQSHSTGHVQKGKNTAKMNRLEEKIGHTVSLRGRAMDAKGGAVLLMPDETPIYIPVLEFWPHEFSGHDVEVRGVLKRKKLMPDSTTDPASQGAQGEDFVLDNASWKKVSK